MVEKEFTFVGGYEFATAPLKLYDTFKKENEVLVHIVLFVFGVRQLCGIACVMNTASAYATT